MQTKIRKKSSNIIITSVMMAFLILLSCQASIAQNSMARGHLPARRMVTEAQLLEEISFLSDKICGGRASGTTGSIEAAFWIQREFERIGLLKFGKSYGKRVYIGKGLLGRNVVGFLPGTKHTSRNKYVIVGAHYDHLGEMNGKIYPGADANASGTVAMLNLAKMFARMTYLGKTYDSNIIFVAFDGKEHNMAGSKAFWRMIENGDLIDPLTGDVITRNQISLMVNIDQIGSTLSPLKSGRKDYIIMLGTNSLHTSKRGMLSSCNRMFAIDMEIDLTYYGSPNFTEMFYSISDQFTFAEHGIPAVMFTSGITMNNNKPYDKPSTLDMEILQKRIYLMYHWIEKML